MVSPSCFAPPDTRRFANHRTPYPQPFSAADSRKASSEHSYPFEAPGGGNMSSGGYEEGGSHQRKRIPVACGRCRKRKIRCSGDNGVGEQCTNCRNAGVSPCQFLRVSSQEAALKQDSGFSYNLMDSRTHHARGLTSLHPTQPPSVPTAVYHEGLPLSTIDAFQPYRNSNAYTYGNVAGGRAYISWGAPAYCDHSQEQQSESSYHHGMYSPSYAPQPESRYLPPYQPTAAAPKPLPPFVDAEPTAYGYGAQSTSIPTTATTTLAHRPAPVVDTTSGSWYQNVASSLSGSAGSSKHPYGRSDSVSSTTVYSKSSSSPTSSLPEMTSASSCGSGSYELSPVSSYPPGISPTQQLPPISRPGDGYTVATSATAPATTSSSSDFPPPSTSSYIYTDTSAAAAAIVARRGPTNGPSNGSHSYTTSSYVVPDGIGDIERKPSSALPS